jgi:hypothetical protein
MLMMIWATNAVAEESLPPGFLEFLGDMVEVEEGRETGALLDPLIFEDLSEGQAFEEEAQAAERPSVDEEEVK